MADIDIYKILSARWKFETSLVKNAISDRAYRAELKANPRKVYAKELGSELPAELKIEIIEEDGISLFLVLPQLIQLLKVSGNSNDTVKSFDDQWNQLQVDLPLLVGAYANWLLTK